METAKSYQRRTREGWFDKYCPDHLSGIDIGCGRDPVNETFRRWDLMFGDSDASKMEGVSDEKFNTVYASHVLEHLINPAEAIRNWYRILKPSGHMIIVVPHRDLYEKKKELPSNWNGDHKNYFLPSNYENPCTISLNHIIEMSLSGLNYELVDLRVLDENFHSDSPDTHSSGEYSIEAIVRKYCH